MKERFTITQVQNEEHRHRGRIQTFTQNKEQMVRRASQVTFVKKIYINITSFERMLLNECIVKMAASQM